MRGMQWYKYYPDNHASLSGQGHIPHQLWYDHVQCRPSRVFSHVAQSLGLPRRCILSSWMFVDIGSSKDTTEMIRRNRSLGIQSSLLSSIPFTAQVHLFSFLPQYRKAAMSYPLTKFSDNEEVIEEVVESEESLIPKNSLQHRRWRALRYLLYFVCCIIGFGLLSQFIARPQTTQIGDALRSKVNDFVTLRTSTPATWIQTRNITQSASVDLENALFHNTEASITSPNKKFRFSFLYNGELLLETATSDSPTQWAPTWWAHSATYEKRSKDGTQYVALDHKGSLQVVRWVADGPTAFKKTHPWISVMQRACSDNIDQVRLSKSLKGTPKPQSLALDDTGRLIIFNSTAHAVCVLTDLV